MDSGEIGKPEQKHKVRERITSAPKPGNSLGGTGGWAQFRPMATVIPPSPPTHFPSGLWTRTNVILLEARKKFPVRTEMLELFKYLTSQMTPIFCRAVQSGIMNADAVLRKDAGGMEDLLHSLLVHNDDGPHSGFSSFSDDAYRLGQNVRQSDEWLALAKAIEALAGESEARKVGRLKATIQSPSAAKRLDEYLESNTIGLTEFANRVGTTDRTLRSFRKTGKVRRDILESIAKQMGITRDRLLEK